MSVLDFLCWVYVLAFCAGFAVLAWFYVLRCCADALCELSVLALCARCPFWCSELVFCVGADAGDAARNTSTRIEHQLQHRKPTQNTKTDNEHRELTQTTHTVHQHSNATHKTKPAQQNQRRKPTRKPSTENPAQTYSTDSQHINTSQNTNT
jgi:hypothetical protein